MNIKKNLTDRSLILAYRNGDVSMLAILVKRYHKSFCERAYWITKNEELAKDIAQESWVIIIEKLHTLKDANSFKTWACRIVYTKAIDGLKLRNKYDRNLETTELADAPSRIVEDHNNIKETMLLKAIQKLPLEKQEVIRLFYAESYSIKEISLLLNIPIGTVKTRLFKAREKLKSIIKNSKL